MGMLIKSGLPRLEELCRHEVIDLIMLGGKHPDVLETVEAYKQVFNLMSIEDQEWTKSRVINQHTGNVRDLEQITSLLENYATIELRKLDRIHQAFVLMGLAAGPVDLHLWPDDQIDDDITNSLFGGRMVESNAGLPVPHGYNWTELTFLTIKRMVATNDYGDLCESSIWGILNEFHDDLEQSADDGDDVLVEMIDRVQTTINIISDRHN